MVGLGASRIGVDVHQFRGGPRWRRTLRVICELIVGLGDVEVLGVDDAPGGPLALHIRYSGVPAGLWGLRRGGVVQGR